MFFFNIIEIIVMLQCLTRLFERLKVCGDLRKWRHTLFPLINKHQDQTVLGKTEYHKSEYTLTLSLLTVMKLQFEIWSSSEPCSLVVWCRKTGGHTSEDSQVFYLCTLCSTFLESSNLPRLTKILLAVGLLITKESVNLNRLSCDNVILAKRKYT